MRTQLWVGRVSMFTTTPEIPKLREPHPQFQVLKGTEIVGFISYVALGEAYVFRPFKNKHLCFTAFELGEISSLVRKANLSFGLDEWGNRF